MDTTIILPWGPFTISAFSLSFSAALLAGLTRVIIAGRKENLPFQLIIDFTLISMICGVIGGRLAHILVIDRNYYFQHLERIAHLQDGGVSFWGGFILALAAVTVWAGRRKFTLKPFLDAAAPALALGLSIGRIGYPWQGKVMAFSYPWGIVQEGRLIHPEGAYAIILLMLLYFYLSRRRQFHYKGERMVFFVAGYGLINIIIDYFTNLPKLAWGWATTGQVVSMALIILAILYMVGGSKAYYPSRYIQRKIKRPAATRLKFIFGVLWALLITAGQLYLYFSINGFPEYLANLIP